MEIHTYGLVFNIPLGLVVLVLLFVIPSLWMMWLVAIGKYELRKVSRSDSPSSADSGRVAGSNRSLN